MPGALEPARSAVGSATERAFLPARNFLEEVGDMMLLTGRTISSTLRPPHPYGGEFVSQFLFTLRLCWLPLLISTVAICYGAPGLQAANFLTIFGALDRLGGFFVLAAVRPSRCWRCRKCADDARALRRDPVASPAPRPAGRRH